MNSMNVKVDGQHEQTVIYQAVQELVRKIYEANCKVNDVSDRDTVGVRELLERITKLEADKASLQDDIEKANEFMRLKDSTKRRLMENLRLVESDRDSLRNIAASATKKQKEIEIELRQTVDLNTGYKQRAARLEEIISLGRKGLQAEDRDSTW